MLVWVDIATRISRVDDHHGNSVLICKSFNSFKINLPTLFRKKIKTANFKSATGSASFIVWEAWPWKQNVGTLASKDS